MDGVSTTSKQNANVTGMVGTGTCVYEEYCELPFTLKTVLMDEWEKITRTGWDSPLTGYYCAPVAQKPARFVPLAIDRLSQGSAAFES
jgi:hypothetical protein